MGACASSTSSDVGPAAYYAKSGSPIFCVVGEGTLVTKDEKQYYSVVQYKKIASTVEKARQIMQEACLEAGSACVGFHIMEEASDGRSLEAALLYDTSKLPAKSKWPPKKPKSLGKAMFSWTPEVERGSDDVLWFGEGPPHTTNASAACGMGWEGWTAYRIEYPLAAATLESDVELKP